VVSWKEKRTMRESEVQIGNSVYEDIAEDIRLMAAASSMNR
jgi:hypothetical protein